LNRLLELDVVDADRPWKYFNAESQVCVRRFVGVVGIFRVGVVVRQARMAQTAYVCYGELVNVVTYNGKFHVAHYSGLAVVVVTVPIIIVAVVAPSVVVVFARLV
jgi:hypothetical protein